MKDLYTEKYKTLPKEIKKTKLMEAYDSVQLSCSVVADTLWPHGLQHTRLPCPSPTPGACSISCPSSWWCYPTISSSVVPFSSCLQSFPASESFLRSQFFTSGGQSIGGSASAPVLPMNVQNWFRLGWTGWISLQSKGFSKISFNFMVAVTIWSDFEATKYKVCHCSYCFPIYVLWSDGTGCHNLNFLNVEF